MAENIDPERIREIEEKFTKLTEVLGNTRDGLDDVSKSLAKESTERDRLIEKNKRSINVEDQRVAATMMATRSYEQQLVQLGLVKNELGKFQRITYELSETQKKHIAEEKIRSRIEEQQNKKIQAAEDLKAQITLMAADKTNTLVTALSKFGKGLNSTLLDSTKGQSKYGEALSGMGDSVIKVTEGLGPFGKMLGLAAGALMKLVGATFKQNEALNEAYETLSEIGAVDSKGIQGMFNSLQDAGFTISEIGKFTKILKEAGPNLTFLGKTAAEGAEKVANSFKTIANSPLEKQLRMLGFNSESLYKGFAQYETLLGRLGFAQTKNAAQLGKSSGEYLKNLDELSKLTGLERDEVAKRQQALLDDQALRSKLAAMGEEESKNVLASLTALGKQFGPKFQEQMTSLLASGGDIFNDVSSELLMTVGPEISDVAKKILNNSMKPAEAIEIVGKKTSKQFELFNQGAKDGASVLTLLGKDGFFASQQIDGMTKVMKTGVASTAELTADQKKQMQMQNDAQRAAEVMSRLTTRSFDQARDRVVQLIAVEVAGAFEKLLKVVHHMGLGLAKFVKGLTGFDLTDLFETQQDLKEQYDTNQKELEEVNKQLAASNESRQKYLKQQEDYQKKGAELMAIDAQYREAKTKEDKERLYKEKQAAEAELRVMEHNMNQNKLLAANANRDIKALEEKRKTLTESGAAISGKYAKKSGHDISLDSSKEEEEMRNIMTQLQKDRIESAKLGERLEKKLYKDKEEELKLQEEKNKFDKRINANYEKYNAIETAVNKKTAAQNAPGGRGSSAGSSGAAEGQEKNLLSGPTENLDPRLVTALNQVAQDYGKPLKINSGYRSKEEQQKLYDKWLEAGGGPNNPKAGGIYMPAKPGGSRHNMGTAVDIDAAVADELARKGLLEKYGLTRPHDKDPVHIQLAKNGGMFNGPNSGYPVLLHGKELVIPMPNIGDLSSTMKSVEKTELGEVGSSVNQQAGSPSLMADQVIALQTDLMNMISNKLDAIENRMAKSNDIQSDILTYSMA